VDFLLHVNHVILGNMSDLEEEAYGKIMDCFQSAQGEQQQALEVNRKLQKDICKLIKLVQTAHHRGIWDLKGLSLETMTVKELMGVGEDEPLPESESEKVGQRPLKERGNGDFKSKCVHKSRRFGNSTRS